MGFSNAVFKIEIARGKKAQGSQQEQNIKWLILGKRDRAGQCNSHCHPPPPKSTHSGSSSTGFRVFFTGWFEMIIGGVY